METTTPPYLLHTAEDIAAFRAKYGDFIRDHLDEYEGWFVRHFPLNEWTACPVSAGKPDLIIGMLCLLFQEGRIAMSVRLEKGRTMIRRGFRSEAERDAWYESRYPKPKKGKFDFYA